jgi:basic amino acid/polyamine antiporter, APA family
MATGAIGEERPTLFLRKATGLVRGWSVRDSMIYACLSTNVVTLGLVEFAYQDAFPKGQLLTAILIGGVWVSFLVIAYSGLVVTIPRAGGDYVWQSRILGSGPRLRDGRDGVVVHPLAMGADLRRGAQ